MQLFNVEWLFQIRICPALYALQLTLLSFVECYERRTILEVDGLQLGFIALDDFKTNKRTVGRHKELADLEALDSKAGSSEAIATAAIFNPRPK